MWNPEFGHETSQTSGFTSLFLPFFIVEVVVFTGLFEVTPNKDALASVLGHEVGHVVANHGGEKVSKVTTVT